MTERRCIQNFVYSSSFSQWIAQNIITFNLVRLVVRVHSPDFPYQSVYNSLVFSAVESGSNEREREEWEWKRGWEGGKEGWREERESKKAGGGVREAERMVARNGGRREERGRREEEGQRERELSNKYI